VREFGTDGIRGRYPDEVDEGVARWLGSAVASVLGPRVAVGRDTRPSGPELVRAVCEGVLAAGGSPADHGVLPTPALSLAATRVDAAIMVTASHNPPEDNGLKVMDGHGRKIDADIVAQLQAFRPKPAPVPDLYTRAVLDLLPGGPWLAGRRVLLDTAGGAATESAAVVLDALGATWDRVPAAAINATGVMRPAACRERVSAFDVAILLDGDGDRGQLMLPDGRLLDGDAMLWLLRRPPVVVGTIMTNLGLERALAAEGIALLRTAVGDHHVADAMRCSGAAVGGEPSGHLLLEPGLPTADGLLACLAAMHPDPRLLAARMDGFAAFPQVQRAVARRPLLPDLDRLIARAAASGARAVVRPSGTEPVVRVMVEHADEATARRLAEHIVAVLEEA
jgi:phosphoglucosamine mutase